MELMGFVLFTLTVVLYYMLKSIFPCIILSILSLESYSRSFFYSIIPPRFRKIEIRELLHETLIIVRIITVRYIINSYFEIL